MGRRRHGVRGGGGAAALHALHVLRCGRLDRQPLLHELLSAVPVPDPAAVVCPRAARGDRGWRPVHRQDGAHAVPHRVLSERPCAVRPVARAARGADARQRSDGHGRGAAGADAARRCAGGCRVLPGCQRLRSRRRRVLGQGSGARGYRPACAGRRGRWRQHRAAAHCRSGRRRLERRRTEHGHDQHRRRPDRPADGSRRGRRPSGSSLATAFPTSRRRSPPTGCM